MYVFTTDLGAGPLPRRASVLAPFGADLALPFNFFGVSDGSETMLAVSEVASDI